MKEWSKIGCGNFFKGWISTKIQHLINEKREGPLNQFENIRWTCEVINIVWESEQDHWSHRNKDKHGHTQEEEAKIKRDKLLEQAHKLFLLREQIEPRYRSKSSNHGSASKQNAPPTSKYGSKQPNSPFTTYLM
jgi:hypothetical protein